MTFMDFISWVADHGPQISTAASAIAALIPGTKMGTNPVLKSLSALVDFLALNVGNAKVGPTPSAVMGEVATGKPSSERADPK